MKRTRLPIPVPYRFTLLLAVVLLLVSPFVLLDQAWPARLAAGTAPAPVRFAVIGDFGQEGPSAAGVAALVNDWGPDLIITTGDNNYPDGAASTIDQNVGQYYHNYIHPYQGSYGPGADTNRFFPTLGNHDYFTSGAQPYFDYFTLPGNERYYDFVWGPVHFFALNSNPEEPDGISATSIQAQWLQAALAASTAPWQVVYLHHSPYSSGEVHGSTPEMQWPFAAWGVDAVVSGHDHTYERLERDGLVYFINGLGGRSRNEFGPVEAGSQMRYNGDDGAMLVTADCAHITFEFVSKAGDVIDTYSLNTTCTEVLDNEFFLPSVIKGG